MPTGFVSVMIGKLIPFAGGGGPSGDCVLTYQHYAWFEITDTPRENWWVVSGDFDPELAHHAYYVTNSDTSESYWDGAPATQVPPSGAFLWGVETFPCEHTGTEVMRSTNQVWSSTGWLTVEHSVNDGTFTATHANWNYMAWTDDFEHDPELGLYVTPEQWAAGSWETFEPFAPGNSVVSPPSTPPPYIDHYGASTGSSGWVDP
jgi:hypothetical protein